MADFDKGSKREVKQDVYDKLAGPPRTKQMQLPTPKHGVLSHGSDDAHKNETDELKGILHRILGKVKKGINKVLRRLLPYSEEKICAKKHYHTDEEIRHRIDDSGTCSCLSVHADKLALDMDNEPLDGSAEAYAKDLLLSVQQKLMIFCKRIVDLDNEPLDGHAEPYAKDLLLSVQQKLKIFCENIVVKAFYQAKEAHRGQKRQNGDPYLKHCVETGMLLASIGATSSVVAAGILHDTLDDTFMCYDCIFAKFGPVVADLIAGVSMVSHLSKLARYSDTASKRDEAFRLHTMVLYREDARVVLIKLADRLHNMMTLDALPLAKQQRIAKETFEIFVPLANRLGISSWKAQLEDLCFKHLNPDQYNELLSNVEDLFDINSAKEILEQDVKDNGIPYLGLCGRKKSFYSIHRKMFRKQLKLDDIHDIYGLRLIVENKEDCYKALKVVHQRWSEVEGKSKDYIVQPQPNGYESLHTVVMVEGKTVMEVQIRTKEMHLQAEFGFAAHWRYKEGECKHTSFVLQIVEWARCVVIRHFGAISGYQSSIGYADSIKLPLTCPSHSDDCPYSFKPNCGEDGPVFVIILENNQISVKEFPANSTIMNLLVERGNGFAQMEKERRPRLNHEPVSDPACKLQMGDVVELTPASHAKPLKEYLKEIQRIYAPGN